MHFVGRSYKNRPTSETHGGPVSPVRPIDAKTKKAAQWAAFFR